MWNSQVLKIKDRDILFDKLDVCLLNAMQCHNNIWQYKINISWKFN